MREIKKVFNPVRQMFERAITEEDVCKEIHEMAAYNGIRLHRNRERIPRYLGEDGKWKKANTGRKTTPGKPDYDGYISLRTLHRNPAHAAAKLPAAIYIEVKRPHGGRHRPAQEVFIREAKEDGVIALFATSWLDVVKELAQHEITVVSGR